MNFILQCLIATFLDFKKMFCVNFFLSHLREEQIKMAEMNGIRRTLRFGKKLTSQEFRDAQSGTVNVTWFSLVNENLSRLIENQSKIEQRLEKIEEKMNNLGISYPNYGP